MRGFADLMEEVMLIKQGEQVEGSREELLEAFVKLFEPDLEGSTVGLVEWAELSGIEHDKLRAVTNRFRLDLGSATEEDVVDAFTSGANPMRMHPLMVTADDRVMLPHNALSIDAVKENFELFLKKSPAWETYAKHRGDPLETRTRVALERVLPGAVYRDGLEYYLPADAAELETGNAEKYTMRVESDHLIVLDDLALIVEDKAVALSALWRSGKKQRIRTDLTGIITKAAVQDGAFEERYRT